MPTPGQLKASLIDLCHSPSAQARTLPVLSVHLELAHGSLRRIGRFASWWWRLASFQTSEVPRPIFMRLLGEWPGALTLT
jgi:hypothetical protein